MQLPDHLCVRRQPAEAQVWDVPARVLSPPSEARPMICENLDDLAEMAFQSLPIRQRVIGRARVRDIVETAVYEWPVRQLTTANGDEAQEKDVFDVLPAQVESSYTGRYGEKEYGFAILSIILVAAISAIVQVLIKWWLEKRLNKDLMETLHNECRAAARDPLAPEGDAGSGRAGDE